MECPVCKEDIKEGAVKCRFCGHILDKGKMSEITGSKSIPVRDIISKIIIPLKNNKKLSLIITSLLVIEFLLVFFSFRNTDKFSGSYQGVIRNNPVKLIITRNPDIKGAKDYTSKFTVGQDSEKVITYWSYDKKTKAEYLILKVKYSSEKLFITSPGNNVVSLFNEDWEYITGLKSAAGAKKHQGNNAWLFIIGNIIIILSVLFVFFRKIVLAILLKGKTAIKSNIIKISGFITSFAKRTGTQILHLLKKVNYARILLIFGIVVVIAVLLYIALTTEWVTPPVQTVSMEEPEIKPGSPLNDELLQVEKKLKQNPNDKEALIKKANILHEKGNTGKLLITAEKAVKTDPQSDKGYFLLAEGYFNQGKYDEAIENYKKSISLNDKNALAHLGMANSYLALNKTGQAEKEYLKVIELDEQNAMAFHNLGVISAFKKDMPKAIEYFNKAVNSNPGMKKAWLNLGISYEKTGEKQKAIESYRKYLEFDPGNRQVASWVKALEGGN